VGENPDCCHAFTLQPQGHQARVLVLADKKKPGTTNPILPREKFLMTEETIRKLEKLKIQELSCERLNQKTTMRLKIEDKKGGGGGKGHIINGRP